VAETINEAILAKQKIGSTGDLINTSRWQKRRADRNYTRFISIPKELYFEFEKNQFFINSLLESNKYIKLYINNINNDYKAIFSNPYCIVFIGGSADIRKWSLSNWKKMIAHILSTYTEDIVIAGGPNDKVLADDLIQAFSGNSRISNLAGKTSLYQLIQLISGAKWMISNETSAPHMAAAVNTPVLVICNGNHYGRFIPYPKEVYDKHYTVFPKEIDTLSEEERIMKFTEGSDLSINSIAPKKVISALENNFI
jgi:ADP-heptose:LPS heptosyltransferase